MQILQEKNFKNYKRIFQRKMKKTLIGTFPDNFINKSYELYIINGLELSCHLKKLYKEIHDVPNIEDFNNSQFSIEKYEKDRFAHVFETGYIVLLSEKEDLSDAILVDGYRRLFTMNVPDYPIFVKVFNPKHLSVSDELKLIHECNFWKIFDDNRKSWSMDYERYFDRGVSLFMFLKTGVNVYKIAESFEKYIRFQQINSENQGSFEIFFKLFFENKYLFDDIKFISQLQDSTLNFTLKKKTYENQKIPLNTDFYTKLSTIRFDSLTNNKEVAFNAKDITDGFENVDAAKELVVSYVESTQYEKKKRCKELGNDFAISYVFKNGEKSSTEIQHENKLILEKFRRTHVRIHMETSIYKLDVDKFISKLNIGKDYFVINNPPAKSVKDVKLLKIEKIKFLRIEERQGKNYRTPDEAYTYKCLIFENEGGDAVEYSPNGLNNKLFYTTKANAEEKPKIKRQEFYIYEFKKYDDLILIKAKTKKRIVEIYNKYCGGYINISNLNNYYYDVSEIEKYSSFIKDINEGYVRLSNAGYNILNAIVEETFKIN